MTAIELPQDFAPSRETPDDAFVGVESYTPLIPTGNEQIVHKEEGMPHGAFYPVSDLLTSLHTHDDRIDFIPADLSRKDAGTDRGFSSIATEADYRNLVSKPAAEHIQRFLTEHNLQNSDVVVRVSPVSLNGGIIARQGSLYVRDIRHVLKAGSDRYPDTDTAAAGFGTNEGQLELHEHVNNAAYGQASRLRERLTNMGIGSRA